MNNETEKWLIDITKKIKESKISLFLGAGCSIESGLPSGPELTKRLKLEFPNCNTKIENFFELCQDIVDTPPYDKDQLDSFITNQLNVFEVSKGHQELCKYDWCSIFTTNYDNIVESAFSNKERLRPCRPLYMDKPIVNVSDKSNTYLFKIMGCVTAQEKEGKMVLTRTDYNRSLQKRNKYLNLLRNEF